MRTDSQSLVRFRPSCLRVAVLSFLTGFVPFNHGAEPLNDLGDFGTAGGHSKSSSYELIDALGSSVSTGDEARSEVLLANGWLAAVSLAVDSFAIPVILNKPPQIAAIEDQAVRVGRSSVTASIPASDPDTPNEQLRLSAISSNQTLVPNGNLVFGVVDGKPQLTITRVGKLFGTSRITVVVSDGELTDNASFQVTFPEEGFESDNIEIRGTTLEVPFQAVIGRRYTLEASVDLINWVVVKSVIADSVIILLSDPEVLANRQRFYRVIVE